MSEIFDLIKAFNRLEDKVTVLNAKIDTLLKSPFQKITLDETAACKLLGISPRTLAVLRCEGKIPFLKIRRRTLYRASDLYKYLKDSTHIKEKPS